jgi:uncharacterized membrane protein YhaH (DUF805 family)
MDQGMGYGYEGDMAGFGFFVLFAALLYAAIVLWLGGRILHHAGYSRWWALTQFVPVLNLIMIWIFAFADWPALRGRGSPAA